MTLCLGLGNLHRLSHIESLNLVQQALDLGISRFDSSVNYIHNLNILDTFFKSPQSAKIVLKIGDKNRFSIQNLKTDLKKLSSIDRSNIATIMLHSVQPAQIQDQTLKYLHDYCDDLGVPLGISCDNKDFSVASKISAFKTFMCTNSLIDYANVPILKNLNINFSQLYFKRILANSPWRLMVPSLECHRFVRKHILYKGFRNNSYEQLFFDIFGRRSLTEDYLFLFLSYFRLNFPGSTLIFGTTNYKHMRSVYAKYNSEIREQDITKISRLSKKSSEVFGRYKYLSRV